MSTTSWSLIISVLEIRTRPKPLGNSVVMKIWVAFSGVGGRLAWKLNGDFCNPRLRARGLSLFLCGKSERAQPLGNSVVVKIWVGVGGRLAWKLPQRPSHSNSIKMKKMTRNTAAAPISGISPKDGNGS